MRLLVGGAVFSITANGGGMVSWGLEPTNLSN